jgi:CRP-like cAMP-binding protein
MINKETPPFSIHALLATYGIAGDELVHLFARHTQHLNVAKGHTLLEPGKICQTAYYLTEGAAVQYALNDAGEEVVIDLHTTGEWVLNHASFVGQKPADVCIKTYTAGTVLELHIHNIHHLISVSQQFIQLGSILEEVNKRVLYFDRQLTPYEKYEELMQHRKAIFQYFPLKMIASYLKITPETLSRVREKIASSRKN